MVRYLLLLSFLASCPACYIADPLPFVPEAPSAQSLEPTDVGGRQDLFIPLGAGLRTDIAADLLPVGHDLEIENMQFDLTGSLVKRFGYVNQPLTTLPGGTALPNTWQLATHKGARISLSQSGPNPIASYSTTDSTWDLATTDRRGAITTALAKIKAGGKNPRIAAGGGYYFLLYADLLISNTYHFDVYDPATGHIVIGQTFGTAGTVLGYDVIFCNGFAVAVTMEQGTGIVFRRMTPSTKAITTTTFAAATIFPAFDATLANATTISVVYGGAGGNAAGVDFVPSTSTATGFAILDDSSTAISLNLSVVCWVSDLGGSGKNSIADVNTGNGVQVHWNLSAGATRTATRTDNVDPFVTTAITQLSAHTTDNLATGSYQVLYTMPGSDFTKNFTKMAIRQGGFVTAGFSLYRSVTLLSKTWTYAGDFFALFCFSGTTDANSYVMRIPNITASPTVSAPQAIFAVGQSGNLDQFGNMMVGLSRPFTVGSNQFVSAMTFLNRRGQDAVTGSSTSLGIELVTISHLSAGDTSTGKPVEAVDSLIVPGGAIGQYDGANYAEMGFAYAPPIPAITPGVGGLLTVNSTYWYVLVYSYVDAQGRLWRSGTSVPASVVLTGGQNQATLAVPQLRITGRSDINIEIYRGGANSEALFQKLTQFPNVPQADSINFTDNLTSDASLAFGEVLYTGENDNAILNNDTIPGSPFVFVFQNRIWFISADDPTELWFSNIISPGNGPRFSNQNIVRIADSHGGVNAAGVMDDKVIAIKGDAVYTFNGDGPDDAGNGQFTPPVIVALGVGSTSPRSVVSFKDGVFFKSTAARPGMQMIDRGLSVASAPDGAPFGAAVERYSSETIVSSILIPEQSQVRFYCASGRVLVYDLVSKAWATFLLNSPDPIISAVATNGVALVATNTFALWLEDNTGATYSDNGAVYPIRVTSPWIQVDGIKGFERIIQLIGVGKTMGDHTLDVQMYKDFDDTAIINEKTWTLTVAANPLWNWEWNRPRVARMSAEKLVLTETSTGAGFRVEGVSETLGIRQGLNRQPTSTRGP